MKTLLLALVALSPLYAQVCPTNFTQVTGPALAPDGSQFNGRMIVEPGINTVVGGSSVRRQRVTVTVTGGVLSVSGGPACLAPGVYSDTNFVTGQTLSYPTTWTVPVSASPVLIQNIESQGSALPPVTYNAALPLVYNVVTAGLSLPAATGSVDGYLKGTDWVLFNGKQSALGFTPENSANKGAANGYAPLVSSLVPLANLPTIPFSQTSGTQAALGFTPGNVANPLSQFANTTSAQLRGVISDETGNGAAVFQNGALGTPLSANLANATGLPLSTGVTGQLPNDKLANPSTTPNGVSCALGATCTVPVAPATFVGGAALTGVTYPAVRGYNLALGTTDLYTAPTGKRSLVTVIGGYNPTAGSVTWTMELKSGGNYYALTSSTTSTTHTAAAGATVNYVLEPGESLSVLTTTTAGLNLAAHVLQFDSTSALRSVKLLGLSTGDNTLYTVPAGKSADIAANNGLLTWNNTGSVINFVADSGGARALTYCSVASGGLTTCAPNSVNEVAAAAPGPSARVGTAAAGLTLASGDFLVANIDTGAATQLAWVNVIEF